MTKRPRWITKDMVRIPLDQIKPLACDRPDDVRRYVTMLQAGSKPPPIWVIKQRRGSRFPFRIFDGAHRTRAAKRAGRTTIDAKIVIVE